MTNMKTNSIQVNQFRRHCSFHFKPNIQQQRCPLSRSQECGQSTTTPLPFIKEEILDEDPLQLSSVSKDALSLEDFDTSQRETRLEGDDEGKQITFKCTACDDSFSAEIKFLVHITKQSACSFCNKRFCSKSNLKMHLTKCYNDFKKHDSSKGTDPVLTVAESESTGADAVLSPPDPSQPLEVQPLEVQPLEVQRSISETGKCPYCLVNVKTLFNLKLHLEVCFELYEYMKKRAIYHGDEVESILFNHTPPNEKKTLVIDAVKKSQEIDEREDKENKIDALERDRLPPRLDEILNMCMRSDSAHPSRKVMVASVFSKIKEIDEKEDKENPETNALEKYGDVVDNIFNNIYMKSDIFFEYACEICRKVMTTFRLYKRHMNIRHGFSMFNNPQYYHCLGCPLSSKSLNFMTQHIYTEHEKVFQCDHCPESFANWYRKRLHILSNHSSCPAYDCTVCNSKFFDNEQLKVHRQWHFSEERRCCTECGGQFKGINNLRNHKQSHRQMEEQTLCPICGIIMKCQKYLNYHMQTKHDDGTDTKILCPDCGCLIKVRQYSHHRKRVHCPEGLIHHCSVCSRSFATKQLLRTHGDSHNVGRPYSCDQCPSAYKQLKNLHAHKRSHHLGAPPKQIPRAERILTLKNLTCTQCGKIFSTAGTLNSHINWVHTGDRNFSCSYCNDKFKRRDAMVAHERRHTNEKPYSCGVCERTFRQKYDCTKHEAKHSMTARNNLSASLLSEKSTESLKKDRQATAL